MYKCLWPNMPLNGKMGTHNFRNTFQFTFTLAHFPTSHLRASCTVCILYISSVYYDRVLFVCANNYNELFFLLSLALFGVFLRLLLIFAISSWETVFIWHLFILYVLFLFDSFILELELPSYLRLSRSPALFRFSDARFCWSDEVYAWCVCALFFFFSFVHLFHLNTHDA